MADPVLVARYREATGKGAARKLRSNKEIPAIFYGPGTDPVPLAVDYPEMESLIKDASTDNIIFSLKIQRGKRSETRKAILKDLQIHPLKDTMVHADFYEISMDRVITVDVTIDLVNTPVGVENGGVLQQVRRELTISCLPGKIMDSLEVDVSGLDIGDALHIEDIELPEGVESDQEGHLTVAVVAAPTAVEEEVEEEAEEIEEAAEVEEEVPAEEE